MNNENIKHLFTPVSEGIPKGGAYFQFIWSDAYQVDVLDYGYYHIALRCWFSLLTDNRCHNVTHWLDLSKLTTKNKAMQLIKEGYYIGAYRTPNSEYKTAKHFIDKNKDRL